jgi:hypothetical protein
LPRSSRAHGARDVRHDDDQPWEGRTPPRKQSRTRQRLVMQFKPCGAYMRTHQATTTGGRDHAHPQSARITPHHPRQHHRDLADHLRGRRRRKGTRASMPFSRAIRSTKHQIKSLDAEHSKLRSLEAIQKKRKQMDKTRNGQTARSSRRARRAPPGRCLALKTQSRV